MESLSSRSGRWILAALLTFAVVSASAGTARTQVRMRASGVNEFRRYCASCHGADAKGGGPVAASLTKKPTDLTMLAKKNAGKFPEERVTACIEGTAPEMVPMHGPAEMPVWGREFRLPPVTGERRRIVGQAQVKREIKLLVDYIKSIQEK